MLNISYISGPRKKPAPKGSKQRIAPHKSTNIHIFQDQRP